MSHPLHTNIEQLWMSYQHSAQPVWQPKVFPEVREVIHQRPLLHRHGQHLPHHGTRPPLQHLQTSALIQLLERGHLGKAMEPQEVVPVRAAEVKPAAEREVRKPPRPVHEAVGRRGGAKRERRRRRRWRGIGELECVAAGGVHESEEVRVAGAKRRAEVHGEAEVGGEVDEPVHRNASARGHKEEAVDLGGERVCACAGGAERGKVGGERLGGGSEPDREGGEGRGEREGGMGLEEAEEGRVSEDHGDERAAAAREAEEAAAAVEHAEREEMAWLGEEEGEELAHEAEAACARRLAVENSAADQLRRWQRWGSRELRRWGSRAPRRGCGGAGKN